MNRHHFDDGDEEGTELDYINDRIESKCWVLFLVNVPEEHWANSESDDGSNKSAKEYSGEDKAN